MADSLERLFNAVIAARAADPTRSRTARLLRSGRSKMSKKVAEEAVEVVISAMNGEREAVVRESADLLYNLVVLWADVGLRPADIWDEMTRREQLLGLAEKMPKTVSKTVSKPMPKAMPDPGRRKVVALTARPLRKR